MYFLLIALSLAALQAQANNDCFNPFNECECANDIYWQGSILNCFSDKLTRDYNYSSITTTTQSYESSFPTASFNGTTPNDGPFYGSGNSSVTDYNDFTTPETTTESTTESSTSPSGSPRYYVRPYPHNNYIKELNVYNAENLTESGLFDDLQINKLHLGGVRVLDSSVFGNSNVEQLVVTSTNVDSLEIPHSVSTLELRYVSCEKVKEILKTLNTSSIASLTISENYCYDFDFPLLESFYSLYHLEFSKQNLQLLDITSFSHNTINSLNLASVTENPFSLPSYFFNMPSLMTLNLSGNPIISFEPNWANLSYGSSIEIDISSIQGDFDLSNLFSNLPEHVSSLIAKNNNMKTLPDLTTYTSLTTLDVSYNQLQVLDKNTINSSYITNLNASYNQIFYVDWNLSKIISQIDLRGNKIFSLTPLNSIKETSIMIDLSNQEQIVANGIEINNFNLQRESSHRPYDYYNYDSYLNTKINLLGNKLEISAKYALCGTSSYTDKYGQRKSQTWEIFIDDLNGIDNTCLFTQFFSHSNTTSVTFITAQPVSCILKAFLDRLGISVKTFPNQYVDFTYSNMYAYERFAYDPNTLVPLDYEQICNSTDYQAAAHIFASSRLECDDFKCPDLA